MFRPLARPFRRAPRRGTSFVLLSVSMLTLFAAVGMGYALYAHTLRKTSGAAAEAQGKGTAPPLEAPDPTGTVNQFLAGLLFDYGDDGADLVNPLRGHSIARSMYGRDLAAGGGISLTPWAGVGLIHEDATVGAYAPFLFPAGSNRARFVNHTVAVVNNRPFLLDPEYMGPRTLTGTNFDPHTTATVTATNRVYVNKAAPYSFADLKDFFLAAVDPVTGQVLVPSFHRDWLFRDASRPATESPLHPNNPNWTNAVGKLFTLRPRPAEHPRFPRVPQNADGSFTGDVQNLPGGVGPQRNDSLWMDIGLPVVNLGNRRVKPLVAPLIVPLNGLLNLSAHGRTTVVSHNGFGPWEVNLAAVLGTDAANVITARMPQPALRNGTNTRAFAPFAAQALGALPGYAPVAWASVPNTPAMFPDMANLLSGQPTFPTGYQTDNNAVTNHASLFNPNEWPGTPGLAGRTFPNSDLKRLYMRYAYMPDWYLQADAVQQAANSLGNPAAGVFQVAPGQNQQNSYRLHGLHGNRMLFTPIGYDLDRPKLVPTFTGNTPLSITAGQLKPTNPTATQPYPTAGSPLATSGADFASQNRWTNTLAALGSVDLNRPLADYRDLNNAPNQPTPQPLSAGNMANAAAAAFDRQSLARDIFARLVAATGANGTVNPTTGVVTPGTGITPEQYNALRYLAQVAVNVVDYIDNDDVNTAFVWNPTNANDPNPQNDANNFGATELPNRVVFGVEKPRLLISEAYSEIANDPRDPVSDLLQPPANDAHVRFWLELVNPANAPPANNILGDGSVQLNAYRVEVARFTGMNGGLVAPLVDPTNPQYLANPTGEFAGGAYDLRFTFPPTPTNPMTEPSTVTPNTNAAQRYAPPAGALPTNGFVLVGPQVDPKTGSEEFAPSGGVWQNAVFSPYRPSSAMDPQPRPAGDMASNSMAYTIPLPMAAPQLRRNVVLLRRLANPYAAVGPTNPYITVDVVDHVPSLDALHRLQGQLPNRGPRSMANMNGYDPVSDAMAANNRFSVGKVQPFAGHATVTAGTPYNQYQFPASMVLDQRPVTPVAGQPKHTFGRYNGTTDTQPAAATYTAGPPPALTPPTETIMAPFDWFVHMDRPLVNQAELFHVRDTAPHHVTDNFVRFNPGTNALDYEQGVGAWRASAGLMRGLEFLTVRSYVAGVPHGGRVPGKINPNVVQDRRVLDALFDPQNGNTFAANPNYMNDRVWNGLMASRSGVGQQQLANGTPLATANAPGQSIHDANAAGQQVPFMRFGAPLAAAGSTFAYGVGGGEGHTILRDATTPTGAPLLFNTATTNDNSRYFQAEPFRKVLNNLTTVNHQYVVFLTIGYFDVENENPPRPAGYPTNPNIPVLPTLGAEAYLLVPGDLRQKFTAVIDATHMALEPATNNVPAQTPFFTALEQTARPDMTGNAQIVIAAARTDATAVYVAADGAEVAIQAGSQLVIGHGADQQVVTVNGPPVGQGTLAVTGMTRTAWGGACVSNVRPGYAGPQPGFNYTDPRYRPVVPYVERVK